MKYLILDRKNFRIQQEVPFKSGKATEDKITLGTQLMKLLFGDEMMNLMDLNIMVKNTQVKNYIEIYNDTIIKSLVNEKRTTI
jgi:hypothetical protein